jgi:hypothetical protein
MVPTAIMLAVRASPPAAGAEGAAVKSVGALGIAASL